MREEKIKSYPNLIQSIGIAGILILGQLIFSPVYIIANKLIGKEASALIYYLLAIGLSFVVISYVKKKKTGGNSYNFKLTNKRLIPFATVISIFLYVGIICPITASIQLLHNKEVFLNSGSQIGFFNFIRFIIATPVLEELIFSGIVLDGLLRKYTPIKSILVTSFLFGLVHLSPPQFISGFVIGIFSGWVYYKTKSLTFSIMIHIVTNLTALLMNHFKIYGFLKYSISLGDKNIIYLILGSILIVLVCIYFLKIEFNKREEMAAHNTQYT